MPLPEASPDETLPASILYEDDELLVVHRPAAGEPTLITFADLTFRPKEHGIWGQEAATKLGLNAIGFVAKRENWFPAASVQAAAPAVRAALRGPALTYGYSMGGYGALKYATLLGAARAFAVCPQTSIAPTEVPWDTRFHKFYKASLHAGMAIGPGEAGEVAVLLADPYMPEDCRHARRISREAGVNWVRTPFMDHAAIWLLVGGDFLPQVMGMIMEADLAGLAGVMRARRHTSPHWFRHAGNAAFRHNHIPLANRLWLRALELGLAKTVAEQDATRALRERMRALNQAGKRDAARDLALLQADLRPESFAIQAQVGHALLGMQEAAAAEQPFRAALKLRKNVGNVYQGLSVVLSSSGRLKEAVTLCRTGMKQAPGDDGLQIHLGHMLLNSGRVEESEEVFRSLLEVNPRHSKALLGLSNSLAARGEREEAIEVARSLITEGESDIQAYLWLGQLLLFMGEPEEAEPVFRQAVSLDNASGAGQIGLARALERSGRMEEARYVATKAAEALPNDAKLQAMARRVGPPAPHLVFDEGEAVQPRSRLRRFFGAFLGR